MKTCIYCKESKSLDDFSWRVKAKGTKHSYCKPCRKSKDAEIYENNTERRASVRETQRELTVRNKAYIRDYLTSHPCVDCGMDDIRVLDFDHLRDKESCVSTLATSSYSIERIQQEIDKCEVRCANCHRIITYERAGWTYASKV